MRYIYPPSMKTTGRGSLWLYILSFILVGATGCIEDKCGGIDCWNEGVCVQGQCACLQGYEGDQCELKWHSKFAGQWSVQEFDRRGNLLSEYELQTISGPAPDTFYLLGLSTEIDTVVCARMAYRSFSMLSREVADTFNLQSGEGTFDEATGNVTGLYSFTKGDVSATYNFTWAPR